MLDGLLKSKFYTKCKTNLKMTKTRVENIKKKKIAVQKFLKNDIADILRNGRDMNAYGRAEGLLIEQNMACCYELVENFCANISSNLSLMEKQRECPEECKEAVACLNYAAARLADLPELRNLRNTFTERFRDSLDRFTNREFMERLSPRTYTKEMKLQLLQDIANEFSIEWDSKALEQKLFTPPTINAKNNISDNDDDKKGTSVPRRNPQEQGNKASGTGPTYRRRDKYRPQSSSEEDDNNSTVTDFSQDDRNKTSSSSAASDDDDADTATTSQTPFRIRPPPYLKPKTTEKSAAAKAEEDHEDTKPKPRSVRQRNNNNLKPPPQQGPRRAAAEERGIDEFLSHYSNKKSAGVSAGAARYVTAPGRAASMPPEQTSPPQRAAGPARAASFQPDGSGGGGVHPKLPGDFDELAARIAALRGK